jgi:hypothetical protein
MEGIIAGLVAVAALTLAVALGGCSKSFCVGSGCSIGADTVASKADNALGKLAKQKGLPPVPPVKCPSSLDTKVGATEHCTATGNFNGQQRTLGIDVKVTSVQGKNYHLDFQTTGFEK